MFDQSFCNHLEYALSGLLSKSANEDVRRCWCDGVLLPMQEFSYSNETLLEKREVTTKAWIDEGRVKNKEVGQFLYDMTIYFGDETSEKLRNNERLEESIPMHDPDAWIFLDLKNRIIEIQLP